MKCITGIPTFVYLAWFRFIYNFRSYILGLWIISVIGCMFPAKIFFTRTSMEFLAPEGTLAYDARIKLEDRFPQIAGVVQLVTFAKSNGPHIIESGYLAQLSEHLNKTLMQSSQAARIDSFLGYEFLKDLAFLQDPKFASSLKQFISDDNSSSFVILNYNYSESTEMAAVLRDSVKSFKYDCEKANACATAKASDFTAGVTGLDALFSDILVGIEHDLVQMDSVTIPLALFFFWLFLKNWKLLMIPLINILTAIIYSFAIMTPISYAVKVSNVAPTLMTSVVLALSTDYALFLLTRFREELDSHSKPGNEAGAAVSSALASALAGMTGMQRIELSVANMLCYAGHVIVTSGFTLTLSFASMIFYPAPFLSTLGIGVSIALVMTMFCNLLLTPSFLLVFPGFFSTETKFFKSLCSKKKKDSKDGADNTEEGPLLGESATADAPKEPSKSLWLKWALFWKSPFRSVLLIVIVLGALVPVAVFVKDMKTTSDTTLVFPRNSKSIKVLKDMQTHFEPGVIAPYYIQLTQKFHNASDPDDSVISKEYFDIVNELKSTLNTSGLADPEKIVSPVIDTSLIPPFFDPYVVLRTFLLPESEGDFADGYKFLCQQTLAPDQSAMMLTVLADFNPFAEVSEPWTAKVREVLDHFSKTYPEVEFTLSGGSVEQIDLVGAINKQFPVMIIATCGLLLVLVGVVFQSLFIPLRGMLTIGLSIAWVYGLATLTIKGPLYWITPIMSFSILVGLGLDYDIFLIARIMEYRDRGFSTSAAIVKGVHKTGRIITGAGIIMAIAFAGLIFSSMSMLNEYALILTSAVLLDTFVVRTAMVPALMQLAGKFNWWPAFGRMNGIEKAGRVKEEDESVNEAEPAPGDDFFNERNEALLALIAPLKSAYQPIAK